MKKKSKGRIQKFNQNNQVVDFKVAKAERAKQEKAARKAAKLQREKEKKTAAMGYSDERHDQRMRKQRNRKRLIFGLIIAVMALVVGYSAYHIVDLKMEQKQLLSEQEQLKKQKKQLQGELDKVNDSEYIEQQARQQLKLIMPGEKLYVLPEEDEQDSGQKKDQKKDQKDDQKKDQNKDQKDTGDEED